MRKEEPRNERFMHMLSLLFVAIVMLFLYFKILFF